MAFTSKTPKGNKTPSNPAIPVRSQAGNLSGMTPMHTPPKVGKMKAFKKGFKASK